MRAATDQPDHRNDPQSDDSVVDIELAAEGTTGFATSVASDRAPFPGEGILTKLLRTRLGIVAGFLTLFHLVFVVVKETETASGLATTSDSATWSLLLRLTVAALTLALLRSPLRLSHRQLRVVEALLFGFEMLVLVISQYLSAVDLIDRRDLVDAVAIQKNGVMRAILLMLCYGIFLPRVPAITARIVLTMAAAVILCHGVVLHHADTVQVDMDDVANHQIVMINALFLIFGAILATLAAWVLRGRGDDGASPGQIGPYRLLRKLDEGGTGAVYLADHEFLKRPCALKLLRAADPSAIARFEREAQAAAMLSHPNTVTIFDSGRTADGTPFCAMEYLPGRCVADLVHGSGPMPASRALYLGRQVCAALAEAHRIGLIHRDLSPTNVFVAFVGGRFDVAKVLDFGAVGGWAAGVENDPAAGGAIAGTPEYVAPEQAVAGRSIDSRADIYGFGALLHFMVTGAPPFERATPADVLLAHALQPVKSLRERVADLPADVEAVIVRCLAKRPEDRYPDARSVAAALRACSCAAEWDAARAEGWWLENGSGSSA